MDLAHLKYPNKSYRKPIQIPHESKALAELLGIIAGDGGIGNLWQLVITVNAKADLRYSHYITALFEDLFGVTVTRRERQRNTLVLVASSTTLVEFLVAKGAVRGNKIKQEIGVPR